MKISFRIKKSPNVSVIIPFYNAQSWLETCLNSVVKSENIEVICVDDGSTDDSLKVVKKYSEEYDFIRIVRHDENKGLYKARLTGIRNAKGKYIGFLDSDDYVSSGYFSELYKVARKKHADIAVGVVVNQNKENVQYIQTRCKIFPYGNMEKNESVYDLYWKQEGRCYHWHTLWNKIYKKKLWTKSLRILEQQDSHLVMLEDFVFSSVLLAQAKRYAVKADAYYCYVEHATASTKNQRDYQLVVKNLLDIDKAFSFVENFLQKGKKYKKNLPYLIEWKERYARYWKKNIDNSVILDEEKEACFSIIEKKWGCNLVDVREEDEYYYELAEILETRI